MDRRRSRARQPLAADRSVCRLSRGVSEGTAGDARAVRLRSSSGSGEERSVTPCARLGCIALAVEGSKYCAVDRRHERVDRTLGLVAPLVPVTDRIEYDEDGKPVRFYPPIRQGKANRRQDDRF